MKSKRAEEIIHDSTKYIGGKGHVDIWTANRVIAVTEEEMIEKAGRVFAESCEMYAGNGKCFEGGECATCARITEFKQKIMEE